MIDEDDPTKPVSDPQEPAKAPQSPDEDEAEDEGDSEEDSEDREEAPEGPPPASEPLEGQYRPVGGVGHAVNAFQWQPEGDSPRVFPEWFKGDGIDNVEPGDWVVRSEDKTSVVKADRFAQDYEAVE